MKPEETILSELRALAQAARDQADTATTDFERIRQQGRTRGYEQSIEIVERCTASAAESRQDDDVDGRVGEMLERVAKAMLADLKRQYRDAGVYVDGREESLRYIVVDGSIDLLELARAAVAAMREPTDLMGLGLNALSGYRPGSHSAHQIWIAMIDKALEETPE